MPLFFFCFYVIFNVVVHVEGCYHYVVLVVDIVVVVAVVDIFVVLVIDIVDIVVAVVVVVLIAVESMFSSILLKLFALV